MTAINGLLMWFNNLNGDVKIILIIILIAAALAKVSSK